MPPTCTPRRRLGWSCWAWARTATPPRCFRACTTSRPHCRRAPYISVDATGCAGAGKFLRRISLTPAGLAPAHTRLLLIRGESKRKLLERVLGGDDPLEYPARIAFLTPGAPLHIHWCP